MANLGSSDTPIKGQDFELPAGAKLAEVNGDLAIVDSNGNPLLRRDETAGEWNLEGTELANIGSVDTEKARINRYSAQNALTVKWDNNAPTEERVQAYDEFNELVASDFGGQLVNVLNTLDDNIGLHSLKFANSRGNSGISFADAWTIDTACRITGQGRNRTTIQPSNDFAGDLWTVNGNGSIWEFVDLKFSDASSNLSSGSGFRVRDAHEVLMHRVEIRSFPDDGLHVTNDHPDNQWNHAIGCWFLDNGRYDVHFDAGTETLREWIFDSCLFDGQNSGTSVKVDSNCDIENLQFSGGRARKDGAFIINSGDMVLIDGMTFIGVTADPVIDLSGRVDGSGTCVITNCTFIADGTTPPANAIDAGTGWDTVRIDNNEFTGFTGDEIVGDFVGTDARGGYNTVTGTRSFDTWYQNTTGTDMDVAVAVNSDADGTDMLMRLDVNDTQSNNPVDYDYRQGATTADRLTLTARVPDGHYYQVRRAGSTTNISMQKWTEQTR